MKTRLEVLEAQHAAAVTEVGQLCHGSCELNEEDFKVAETLTALPDFKGQSLAKKRQAAKTAADLPREHIQKAWKEQDVFNPDLFFEPFRPSWLRTVCSHRDHLQDTALVFLGLEERHFYLFLYATQKPLLAV